MSRSCCLLAALTPAALHTCALPCHDLHFRCLLAQGVAVQLEGAASRLWSAMRTMTEHSLNKLRLYITGGWFRKEGLEVNTAECEFSDGMHGCAT